MNSKSPWFLALLLLALVGLICPAAQAYDAPCQNVTGPTSVLDPATGHRLVKFSVVNPAHGQTYSHSEDLGLDSAVTVDSLISKEGIVAWVAYTKTNFTYHIYYAVFDPGPGRGWTVQSTDIIIIDFTYKAGLVGVHHGLVCFYQSVDIYESFTFTTYDPSKGQWISFVDFAGSSSGWDPYFKDGVISVTLGNTLYYAIYDTANGGYWNAKTETGLTNPVITGISYGTVQLTVNGVPALRGYDWKTQTWSSGNYTRAYAGFVAQPTSANLPLTVWLTDVSFGTDSDTDPLSRWTYTFGDGNTAHVRSTYHVYTGRKMYTCSLNYFNSNYTDTESVTIDCSQLKPRGALPVLNLLLN